jgi:predicted dehydrogenase
MLRKLTAIWKTERRRANCSSFHKNFFAKFMTTQKIGIAFLGSGFAQKVQAPAFEAVSGTALIGAASPTSAEAFAKAFQMPVHTTDWKSLVTRDDVQLVCITSPPVLHFEQTLFALEQGKHVLCEKPFTMTLAEAEKLAAVAKEKKLLALIDHELRFSPARRFVKKFIEDGELGKLYHVSAEAQFSSRRDKSWAFNWWADKKFGGGVWGAIASHLIDQLRFFSGEIKSASVVMNTSIDERPNDSGGTSRVTSDDSAAAVLQFEAGHIGQVFTSVVSNDNRLDVTLTGEKGSLKIDMTDTVFFAANKQSFAKLDVPLMAAEKEIDEQYATTRIKGRDAFSKNFLHYAHAIVKTLHDGKTTLPLAATFADGVKIQRVLDVGWHNSKD